MNPTANECVRSVGLSFENAHLVLRCIEWTDRPLPLRPSSLHESREALSTEVRHPLQRRDVVTEHNRRRHHRGENVCGTEKVRSDHPVAEHLVGSLERERRASSERQIKDERVQAIV